MNSEGGAGTLHKERNNPERTRVLCRYHITCHDEMQGGMDSIRCCDNQPAWAFSRPAIHKPLWLLRRRWSHSCFGITKKPSFQHDDHSETIQRVTKVAKFVWGIFVQEYTTWNGLLRVAYSMCIVLFLLRCKCRKAALHMKKSAGL